MVNIQNTPALHQYTSFEAIECDIVSSQPVKLIYIGECVCLCVYPSKHIGLHVAVCGPIGTKFGAHMQIHLEKVVGKIKICPV